MGIVLFYILTLIILWLPGLYGSRIRFHLTRLGYRDRRIDRYAATRSRFSGQASDKELDSPRPWRRSWSEKEQRRIAALHHNLMIWYRR